MMNVPLPFLETEPAPPLRIHPNQLDVLNHYCFEGKRDFSQGMEILVTDEGDGDALIFLAEQLASTPVSLTYLPSHPACLQHVKQRAKLRKLEKIHWMESTLSDLSSSSQRFDYMSVTISLDQLESPVTVLQQAKKLLKEEGVLLGKLDGYYGRKATAQIQTLLQLIESPDTPVTTQLEDLRLLQKELPPQNWYRRQTIRFPQSLPAQDDATLYRQFLAPKGPGYNVMEVLKFIETAGLHFLRFVTLEGDANQRYAPETALTDPYIHPYLQSLTKAEQYAVAELLYTSSSAHFFYASMKPKSVPSLLDEEMVPFFASHFYFPAIYDTLAAHIAATEHPMIKHEALSQTVILRRTPYTVSLAKAIDGKRSVREIIDYCLADKELPKDASKEQLWKELEELYQAFHRYDWMLLRKK